MELHTRVLILESTPRPGNLFFLNDPSQDMHEYFNPQVRIRFLELETLHPWRSQVAHGCTRLQVACYMLNFLDAMDTSVSMALQAQAMQRWLNSQPQLWDEALCIWSSLKHLKPGEL